MNAAEQRAEEAVSIGAVIDQLRAQFPDVSVSKIRFLEAEGLVNPQRTASGYRRFGPADVERLRFVLTAQRDQYLPLKVIRQQLDSLDAAVSESGPGTVASLSAKRLAATGSTSATAEDFRTDTVLRMTKESVVEKSGASPELVDALVDAGIVVAGRGGYFDQDAVVVARTANALAEHGVEVRHLRGFRTAADRQASLIEQIASPIARSSDRHAKDRAQELVLEVAALSVTLHSILLTSAVRSALDVSPGSSR